MKSKAFVFVVCSLAFLFTNSLRAESVSISAVKVTALKSIAAQGTFDYGDECEPIVEVDVLICEAEVTDGSVTNALKLVGTANQFTGKFKVRTLGPAANKQHAVTCYLACSDTVTNPLNPNLRVTAESETHLITVGE